MNSWTSFGFAITGPTVYGLTSSNASPLCARNQESVTELLRGLTEILSSGHPRGRRGLVSTPSGLGKSSSPAGRLAGPAGDHARLTAPAAGAVDEWVCTATGLAGAAVWSPRSLISR